VGYLGHADGIKLELTARENLKYASALYPDARNHDINQALADMGLAAIADVECRYLSAGQRRRAAIARLQVSGSSLWVTRRTLYGAGSGRHQPTQRHS